MQKALFPLANLRISQTRFCTESGSSHGKTNAMDLTGPSPGVRVPVFAPYDMRIVWNLGGGWNIVVIESTSKVLSPEGVQDYQWMALLHKNDVSHLAVGQTYKQGAEFYGTGTKTSGGSVPEHVHIECGYGKWKSTYNYLSDGPHSDMEKCLFLEDSTPLASTARKGNCGCPSTNDGQNCKISHRNIKWTTTSGNTIGTGGGGGDDEDDGGSTKPPVVVDPLKEKYEAALAERDKQQRAFDDAVKRMERVEQEIHNKLTDLSNSSEKTLNEASAVVTGWANRLEPVVDALLLKAEQTKEIL